MSLPISKVLSDQISLLLFRPFKPNIAQYGHLYLAWGLFTTWLVGIGRYWDHPSAQFWQYWGLGSVSYVFFLALLIWVIAAPLRPDNWSYRNVLIFVALTSLPALLYAIPVEKFMALHDAQSTNVKFLAIVALWRVALLFKFLRSVAGFDGWTVTIVGLLPLVIIVTVLVALNLEQAVFNIMGSGGRPTQNDSSYTILSLITFLSLWTSPILLIVYCGLIRKKWREDRIGE